MQTFSTNREERSTRERWMGQGSGVLVVKLVKE